MITLQEVQDRGWHTSLDGYAYEKLDDAKRADIYYITKVSHSPEVPRD